jgi:hypothetical protein
MPSLDGGHYFLTTLLPIDNRGIVEHQGLKSSPVHMVRDALEALPTALHSRAAEEVGIQSPFARSLRTHFVRIVVLDQPFYNGRDGADSILSAIEGTDLLKAQAVDRLACPYIFFIADFDPVGAGPAEPRAYLEELWTLARPELCSVFQYCYGFDPEGDAAAFATFVMKGQLETTMPFNDYWITPPPLPSLSLWTLLIPPAVGLVLGVAALMHTPVWLGIPVLLAALAVGVYFDYALVMGLGKKPFPTAPNSTLRDVLKALYLQQAFTRFAAAHQGQSAAELRAALSDFLAQTKPNDLDGPTQPPGVIKSDLESLHAHA